MACGLWAVAERVCGEARGPLLHQLQDTSGPAQAVVHFCSRWSSFLPFLSVQAVTGRNDEGFGGGRTIDYSAVGTSQRCRSKFVRQLTVGARFEPGSPRHFHPAIHQRSAVGATGPQGFCSRPFQYFEVLEVHSSLCSPTRNHSCGVERPS